MTADSPETRIGRLETSVAKLEQRVDDHETDIRALGPLLQSQAVVVERMERMKEDVNNLANAQRAIVERLDAEAEKQAAERRRLDEREQEREDRERKDRFVRMTTLITLLLVFLSTTAAVLALVVH